MHAPAALGTLLVLAAGLIARPPSALQAREQGRAVYEPPQRPLDERINPARITEIDPPPLPEQVILPMPPSHRIAGGPEEVPVSKEHFEKGRAAILAGLESLRKQQEASGAWLGRSMAAPTDEPGRPTSVSIAVTALVLKAMAQSGPEAAAWPELAGGLRVVRQARRDDGSFSDGPLQNYITSIVVSSLASMDKSLLREEIDGGLLWLQSAQWDQSEGLGPRQDWFGGAGYGKSGRPDLSNTQMMLEALYDAGMSPDEPAFQRALCFLSRAQNLREVNGAAWTGNDGGFVYTPANGGESMASEYAGEGRSGEHVPEGNPRSMRSYGSMTYAGFKSLLYAGLSADDIRVRAAFDWIRRHWTFDENPGLGRQGLYYYCHALARALRVAQQVHIVDGSGEKHNWRQELIDALVARQRPDGSWVNQEDRWLEGEPVMATAYAILALEEALKPVVTLE